MGRRSMLISALVSLALAGSAFASPASRGDVDHAFMPVPGIGVAEERPPPKFTYVFGSPARWPGPLRWRYNPEGAPPAFADVGTAVSHLKRTFDAWTAVCGVTYVYDGETSTLPNTRATTLFREGPDYENVVGWGALDGQSAGVTYGWYRGGVGGLEMIDADIILSPAAVTGGAAMERVATHEWGHALGIGHSDVGGVLMSGPPLSSYNSLSILRYDDVRGCRCLYGPARGQQVGYSCSAPASVDLGFVPIGMPSMRRSVTLRNDGNGPWTIEQRVIDSPEISTDGGCAAGTTLLPGASCSFGLVANVAYGGANSTQMAFQTSDGPYLVRVRFEGTATPGPPVMELVEYVHEGFGHYFVTGLADEIRKLDDGTFAGWTRTLQTLRAWPEPQSSSVPVCRFFYARFAPKSSHFYTASRSECEQVKGNGDWQFEGEVFHVALPDAAGSCPPGTRPVYRLYNRGASGAPNHRFTTDPSIRGAMVAQGWQPEGAGPGVTMCVP